MRVVTASVAAALIVSMAGWYYLYQGPTVKKRHVLAVIASKELVNKEKTFERYRSLFSPPEQDLYQGYIERAKGNIEKSSAVLNQALVLHQNTAPRAVIKELYLNRMLNAYLENDFQQLSLSISQGSKFLGGSQEWIHLFQGIESLARGNVLLAKTAVSKSRMGFFLSPPMKAAFEEYFPAYWRSLFMARCDIALGNQKQAREVLQAISPETPPKAQEMINFLLALCYMKDADAKSYRIAAPYYKLASGYFRKVALGNETYSSERNACLGRVKQIIDTILKDRSFRDLPVFSKLLVQLGTHNDLEELRHKLYRLDLNDLSVAANVLELFPIALRKSETMANQLGDAQSLYRKKKFQEAKAKARMVLSLDPENREAKKILGLIAYEEGDDQTAYLYLKDFTPSDSEMMKVLATTYILIEKTDEGKNLVNALEERGVIDDDFYFRLAFGALIQDQPLLALEWFEKVDPDKPAALAGRCFTAFQMDSWQETIECFQKLPKLYQALDGYYGIAIESHASLGDVSQAEGMLNTLLNSPPEPDLNRFPEYFHAFKKKKLDLWNRYYVAGFFYKIVKGNPMKALEFFNKMERPSPLAEIEMAQTYMSIGNLFKAKEILTNLLKKTRGADNARKIQLRLLPILAGISYATGFYPEAVSVYRDYFSLESVDDSVRIPFAKALMAIRRFDLALEEFKSYQKEFDLEDSDKVDFIESLVKANEFEAANTASRHWLANHKVPMLYQIKLARLLVITKYKPLIDIIFSAIREKGALTLEEKQELILLWIDLGNYEKALLLAESERRNLESTVEGLMVLVELYARLLKDQEALELAELAFQLAPENPRVAKLLEKYERSPAVIATATKLLKNRLEDDPDSPTLQLDYATNLTDLAIETYSAGGVDELESSNDLQTARSVLETLTKQRSDLPESFFLLGKVYYLLDQTDNAKSAYRQAIKLNVSDTKAYQHLALVIEEEGKLTEAIVLVRKAARFAPSNAEVWIQLGDLLVKTGEIQEAIGTFTLAKRYAPNAPEPYLSLADVYLKTNEPASAIENLERALELSPKNIEAVKMMLLALYDEGYIQTSPDMIDLERQQMRFFDKLEALDPEEAQKMRERLGVIRG